jgi:hypothetical protein
VQSVVSGYQDGKPIIVDHVLNNWSYEGAATLATYESYEATEGALAQGGGWLRFGIGWLNGTKQNVVTEHLGIL